MKLDFRHGQVEMIHGSGGRAMVQLIDDLFATYLGNDYLAQGNDGAMLPAVSGRLVMTTDSHVVSPLFFPGGDIGSLAVHGTVNDLAVMGARPLYLAAAFILEEGFPLAELERIVRSMAAAAAAAGVCVVTGDTKVVEPGKGDGVFITTTGFGTVRDGLVLSGRNLVPGDSVLLSGSIGEHGLAILTCRAGLSFDTPIVSDSAPLNGLVDAMLDCGAELRVMRDPTRGGLASTLNELARQSGVSIQLEESAIPVSPAVAAACEFLGLDPCHLANEGKLVAVCAARDAERLVHVMRALALGQNAAIIGEVVEDSRGFVQMRTRLGGQRILDWPHGDPLPRIC